MPNFIDTFYDKTFELVNVRYVDELLKAKDHFFAKTGKGDDDALDYESKMDFFNEWFLFNYKRKVTEKDNILSIITKENEINFLSDEEMEAIQNNRFSLFEFIKKGRKGYVVRDWFNNKKIILSEDQEPLGFLKGEIFLGRIVSVHNKNYFLKGLSHIPTEVKAIIKKQLKYVLKNKVDMTYEEFLFKLEDLKTKVKMYPHVPAEKLFQF